VALNPGNPAGTRLPADGEPADPESGNPQREAPGPTPPLPKIPPRPLDWPPGEGVPVPDQRPAGSP